jgi:hypothetical protein
MAKLKTDKIISTDLLEYLNSYSDFSFELAVLKMLRSSHIDCEHGGHYEDPVTNKSREFDIRATKTIQQYRVRMAIECKNIRENFPILISCIPRHEQESYHQIALVADPKADKYHIVPSLHQSRATALSMRLQYSLYKPGEPVGKSTAQIGRAMDGTISTSDAELYEKWGQCLSSTSDLVHDMYWDGHNDKETYFSTVVPFVVVPNGRLWMVTYDDEGNRTSDPEQTDRCPCFVNKDYEMGSTPLARARLWLSHIEIVTFDGMRDFVERHLKTEEGMEKIFPREGMIDAHQRRIKKKT